MCIHARGACALEAAALVALGELVAAQPELERAREGRRGRAREDLAAVALVDAPAIERQIARQSVGNRAARTRIGPQQPRRTHLIDTQSERSVSIASGRSWTSSEPHTTIE